MTFAIKLNIEDFFLNLVNFFVRAGTDLTHSPLCKSFGAYGGRCSHKHRQSQT